MDKPVIVVGSVTYAMKGHNILAQHGFQSNVVRVYQSPNGSGCGYGIYVPQSIDRAEALLKQNGIPVSGRAEGGYRI